MGIESEQVNNTTVWSPLLWRVKVALESRAHFQPLNGIPSFRADSSDLDGEGKGDTGSDPSHQQQPALAEVSIRCR